MRVDEKNDATYQVLPRHYCRTVEERGCGVVAGFFVTVTGPSLKVAPIATVKNYPVSFFGNKRSSGSINCREKYLLLSPVLYIKKFKFFFRL